MQVIPPVHALGRPLINRHGPAASSCINPWKALCKGHATAPMRLGNRDNYGYDGLYQLLTLDRGTQSGGSFTKTFAQAWTFDNTGNWTNYKVDNTGGGTWNPNQNRAFDTANQVTEISGSGSHVGFDANGNMTKAPKVDSWSSSYDLVYDAWNRLVQVKAGADLVAEYAYDGFWRRMVKKTYSGGVLSQTRYYFYSLKWQVLEERTAVTGSPERQFVWGLRYIDDLILRQKGTERLYALHDYYSVTAITNTSGTVQERYAYDGYGNPSFMNASFALRNPNQSSFGWETTYGAYRYDAETGYYQCRYRYFHPQLGRWLSRDPIGEEGGLNLYAYVGNSPVNAVDFRGLAVMPPSGGGTIGYWPAPIPKLPHYPGGPEGGNCYNYACNLPPSQDKFPYYALYPGQRAQLPDLSALYQWTCDTITARVKADYPGDALVGPPKDGVCPPGYHKIRPEVARDGSGFHFKRQNPDRSWSEKLGNLGNPKFCNPNKPGFEDDQQCPDICVPN